MAYTSLTAASIGDDVILTSTTMQALYDNPTAIAQRLTGAPIVAVPVLDVKTSGTEATWTWPDGVTAVKITLIGGGGGGRGGGLSPASAGGASSISYNSVTVTAGGGGGGSDSGASGGTATNGTVNIPGNYALVGDTRSPTTPLGFGNGGAGYGSGGSGSGSYSCGATGAAAIYRTNKVNGLNTITYTVGSGGASGSSGGGGTAGLIIFEY